MSQLLRVSPVHGLAALMDTSQYTAGAKIAQPVEYNSRDLILYAVGIGSTDLRYVYEHHPDFAAFPTYPIVLTFKGASPDVVPFPPPTMMALPVPPLSGVRVLLDAEKLIEKVAELPREGAKLKLVGSVVGIHAKGKGALLEKEYEIVDEEGKVYYRIVDGSFLVGAKDFKDSGRTYSKAVPPPPGQPAQVIEMKTDQNITHLYRLSGDYNPLHIDHTFAKMAGFDKPIIHGLCTLGHVTRGLLETFANGDQRRFKSVQLRFASPVLPGQTLVTEVWQVSPTEHIFQTRVKETGKICVSNGRFLLTPGAKL